MKNLFQEDLKPGSQGLEVAILQSFLLGFGCNSKIIVNGVYAHETEVGVSNFQSRNTDLMQNGIFNLETRIAFLKEIQVHIDASISNLEEETVMA